LYGAFKHKPHLFYSRFYFFKIDNLTVYDSKTNGESILQSLLKQ